MKKTIFFGLLVITLLVFASCTTIPTFDDEPGGGVTVDNLSSFYGKYEIDFEHNFKTVYSDTFRYMSDVILELSEDPDSSSKFTATIDDYNYVSENTTVSFSVSTASYTYSDNEFTLIFEANYSDPDGRNEIYSKNHTFEFEGNPTNINSLDEVTTIEGTFTVILPIIDSDIPVSSENGNFTITRKQP
jgi:hypothetical protein